MQSGVVPETVPAFASGFTVRVFDEYLGALHPVVTVYVISVVPAVRAVTRPVEEFTEATAGLVLLHEPAASPLLE